MTELLPHIPITVQTATGNWPSDDSLWVTQPLMDPISASEGAGQVIGELQLAQWLGNVKEPNAETAGPVTTLPDMLRTYVRLLRDVSGTLTPFWWGTIEEAELDDDQRKKTWTCVGLAGLLAGIFLRYGAEAPVEDLGSGNTTDPGYLPPFNAILTGDMTAAVWDTVEGMSFHVFDRYRSSAIKWTAVEALRYVLVLFGQPRVNTLFAGFGGIFWQVDDTLGALGYTLETGLDFSGGSLLDAVNYLINPRRGLTWKLKVEGTIATIVVCSTLQAPITVGAYTLPASTSQFDVDLTSVFHHGVRVRASSKNVMEVIQVIGAHPRSAISAAYGNPGASTTSLKKLDKGWTTTQEDEADLDNPVPHTEDVWRRWVIQRDWTGVQFNRADVGLRSGYSPAVSAAYGWEGWDGGRTFYPSGIAGPPPPWTLRLDGHLPAPAGYDLSTYGSVPFDVTKAELAPLVFIGKGETQWKDYSTKFTLRIEQDPPAVCIGHTPADRKFFRDTVTDSDIILTLSFRESWPLTVSWNADPDTWASDLPRMLVISVPNAELWTILAGTVVGIGESTIGALVTMPSDAVIRDDRALLREVLALARAWYGSPGYEANWGEWGAIDISDAGGPGSLVHGITTLNDGTKTVDGIVTRRAWDFRQLQQRTSWTVERIVPDLQATT